ELDLGERPSHRAGRTRPAEDRHRHRTPFDAEPVGSERGGHRGRNGGKRRGEGEEPLEQPVESRAGDADDGPHARAAHRRGGHDQFVGKVHHRTDRRTVAPVAPGGPRRRGNAGPVTASSGPAAGGAPPHRHGRRWPRRS
ncbi:MAG: hypothetical protein ACK55I_42160, partial [bacterium]